MKAKKTVDSTMDRHHEMIPAHVLDFFNDVNTYIDVLPKDFKLTLTDYMHLLAWQITENLHSDQPDEYFDAIRLAFSSARARILH